MSKFKVLCLHGYQQNAAIFARKSGAFRKTLKKDVDFVFMNAPHLIEIKQTEGIVSAVSGEVNENFHFCILTKTEPADYRGWWYVPECYSTKEVKEYEGFEESVKAVVEFAHKQGPFDGILGFSQGAALAFLVAALRHRGDISISLKFLILISGFPSRNSGHQELNNIFLPELLCLHIYGQSDEIISYKLSAQLVERFDKDKNAVIEHPGGHMIPNLSKYKTTVDNFLNLVRNT